MLLGCDPSSQPVVLIGKGIVFNSGCFCLKTCEEMKHMQGDLAGVCDFQRFCKIGTTLNFIRLQTLGENMPGAVGKSMDIVKSSSGNSILEDPRDDSRCLLFYFTILITFIGSLALSIQPHSPSLTYVPLLHKSKVIYLLLTTAVFNSFFIVDAKSTQFTA